MLKPIKVTLLGVMAATTTTLAIPQANAFSPSVGQQPEASEQVESTLVASRWRSRWRKRHRIRRVRWRKKWVCFKRPVVFYHHGRKIVKFKRHCHWKRFRVHHGGHHF